MLLTNQEGIFTGIALDGAADAIEENINPLEKGLLIKLLRKAEKNCFKAGLTTVTDAGISTQMLALLDSLQKTGDLKIGIYAMLKPEENVLDAIQKGPLLTERLTARGFKLYADGALGSKGALLKKPYSDDSTHYGIKVLNDSIFDRYAKACYENDFQLCVHCIGDSATSIVLKKYAEVLQGITDLRWRIEHAQVVSEHDRTYFRDYAIIPSMQPTHATSDMAWAEARLGDKRIKEAYALKSLKNQLGLIALGTDFPVEELSPIATFYAAVFRKSKEGLPKDGFLMDQALTRQDALRGMTIWAAIASFEEDRKGSLEEGKQADFIILDRDIMTAKEEAVLQTKVESVYVWGEYIPTN